MAKPFNSRNPLAYEWTQKAFDLLQAGKLDAKVIVKDGITVVRVDGVCPYCDDHLHYTDSLTAVTEGSEGALGGVGASEGADEALREGAVYQDFTVTCGCSESHDGDPKKSTGCGTSFSVSLLVSS